MDKIQSQSKLWTLPNILTYGRILAVFGIVGLLYSSSEPWARWSAFALYSAAGITDFFDGYLARLWGQVSHMGKMLDPIADKLLVASCLLILCADGSISGVSVWAAMIILCREILVSGLREYLAGIKVSVPVSTLAKWKTTLQIFALGFLIVGQAGESVLPGNVLIGTIMLWIAAAITLYTGYDYSKNILKYISD